MTRWTRLYATGMVFMALAGCTHQPHQPRPRVAGAAASVPGRIPPQGFAPGLTGEEGAPPPGVVLTNDPSAPADTPLCGHAVREANSIGATVHPDITPVVSSCAANACFDAQTGTYIAADGSRRVCR